MAYVISVSNQKGGVGKTTSTINLSCCLAMKGYRTLLVDLDPQSNSTSGLGIYDKSEHMTVYDIMTDSTLTKQAVVKTSFPSLSVLISDQDLSACELELVNEFGREYKLKEALDEVQEDFDFIIIDTPPTLGLLTVNALTASSGVIIPTQSEYYALEGLSQLIKTINLIKKRLNPSLDIAGLLITMFDRRNKLSKFVENEVRDYFGDKTFETMIPRNVRLSEAPSHGIPCVLYDSKSTGARAYIKLTEEFIGRLASIKSEETRIGI